MRFLVVLIVILASQVAWAGDPCPIKFDFIDLGSPSWLAAEPPLAKLKRQQLWIGMSWKDQNGKVVITQVFDGSPAEKAGLQTGDLVLAFNGQAVPSRAGLTEKIDQLKPGDRVVLSVKRGTTTLECNLTTGHTDPLIFDLFTHAQTQECSDPSFQRSNLLADKRVAAAIFEKQRAFRCDDAHAQLQHADLFPSGTMVLVRGARRVLIATVGWQTTCVDAVDYDQDSSGERIKKLFETISRRYVEDRYRHP